jgi:tetratricopeptide (TPR) repeat protein
MTVLGSLEAIRPEDDEAMSGKVGPVSPGDSSVPVLATAESVHEAKARADLVEMIYADAERSRDRALRLVDSVRTSTTLAALAQTHATLGEAESALAAAREAIDLSVVTSDVGVSNWLDTSSVRIAAEILVRFGEAQYAHEALHRAPMTESLCLTFMSVAAALGECEEAENALAPYGSPMVAASRGYLRACLGDFQGAVKYLRQAVREEPADADSLMNLAISLWNLGATRKATRTALQATRSAPSRKDISLLYLELLLADRDIDRLTREIAALHARKVVPDAKFLEVQARTVLLRDEKAKAITLLTAAVEQAKREGDQATEGTTRADVVRLKHVLGRISHEQASQELVSLLSQFPDNDTVVVNFAEVALRRHEAPMLRKALSIYGTNLRFSKGTTMRLGQPHRNGFDLNRRTRWLR